MFNSLKYLIILLIILPFPSKSNSLFQKIDLKLNKNIILNDENNIEKKLINILDFNSKYVVNFITYYPISFSIKFFISKNRYKIKKQHCLK